VTAEDVEAELAAAHAAGDVARTTTLALQHYGPQILRYLRGTLRNDGELGDVYSRFTEKLWLSLPAFARDCTFSTWCHKLAWYAVLEHRRGIARRRERGLDTGEASAIVQHARDSTAAFLKTEAKDRLAVIRDALDPEERSLLLLRMEQQLPWRNVAAIMADEGQPASEAALRKRFERLREKLRTLFKDHGLRP
jgi:RNA polymerase sigma-70 factor (ECF subfamily)